MKNMQNNIVLGTSIILAAAGTTLAQPANRPDLQLVEPSLRVEPIRVAPATIENGQVVMLDDWIDYSPASTRAAACADNRIFDCYGDHNFDGIPDDAGGCGLGDSRWFFGTGYCGANFVTNDMTLAPDTVIEAGATEANFAWYWTCGGSGSEQCILAVFAESSDTNQCEPDSFDLNGWVFDFGDLQCNPGGYYFTNLNISDLGVWVLPESGKGSHSVLFLTDNGSMEATCAQVLYWGASNSQGGDPDGPGTQGPNQFEDSNGDMLHQPDECLDLTRGLCPDPLGMFIQFWGTRQNPPLRGDFDGNGVVDTRDVLAFLTAWNSCDPEADCNLDGDCNTQDVTCFLNGWTLCH